jgi:hypothetical protein
MLHFLHNNRIYPIIAGGFMLLDAWMQRVKDPRTLSSRMSSRCVAHFGFDLFLVCPKQIS